MYEIRTGMNHVMGVLDINSVDQIDSSLASIASPKFSSAIERYIRMKNVPPQLCTVTKRFLEYRRSVGLMKDGV